MKKRVVITGMGAISPVGNDTNTLWQNIQNGVCGIDEITLYDTSEQKVKIAAEVKNLDFTNYLDKSEIRKMDRFTKFAVIAAKEAITQSGIEINEQNEYDFGVMVSSGIGGIETIAQECKKGFDRGFDKVSPFFIPMAIVNMAAGTIAIKSQFKGICTSVVTACAGATNAIGDAFRCIRDGYATGILCGGTESAITPLGIGGFTSLKALNESNDINRASIPFDLERKGFVMGEGAGILFLEEYEHAKARGAKILCEVVGYGATCDAYHMTAPDPDGMGAYKSMLMAVRDAKISPDEIDYINAHGTSTPLNDKGETKAVKKLLGDDTRVLISSTKSMTGHLLGASGGIEAIITACALKDSIVPPTINYKVFDPECDLDIVANNSRKKDIKYALSNSLGFGGHNASILLKKYEE